VAIDNQSVLHVDCTGDREVDSSLTEGAEPSSVESGQAGTVDNVQQPGPTDSAQAGLEGAQPGESVSYSANSDFSMLGCRINRPQLDRIWRLATDGFSTAAIRSVATKRRNGGIESEIKGDSIDGVLKGVREATLAGDPDRVYNLSFSISEPFTGEVQSRSVSIRINDPRAFTDRAYVHVTGADAGWVRGRTVGLKELFAETQSSWFTGQGEARFALPLAGVFLWVVTIVTTTFTIASNFSTGTLAAAWVCLLVVPSGLGYLGGTILDGQYRTQLLLISARRKRRMDWIALTTLIATIVGVIVATVAIWVAHSDAIHPH
jgi:hypothetical protein